MMTYHDTIWDIMLLYGILFISQVKLELPYLEGSGVAYVISYVK